MNTSHKIIVELPNSHLELFDDCHYTPYSTDNPVPYKKIYLSKDIEDRSFQIVARVGILLRDKIDRENLINSAIICESGGATHLGPQSFLIRGNELILCICNHLYSLDLNSLDLNWRTQVDDITCFSLHEFGGGILTHGELQLSFLNFNGTLQWEFLARDIFVTYEESPAFRIENDLIVKDFSGYEYHVNSKGEVEKEIPT